MNKKQETKKTLTTVLLFTLSLIILTTSIIALPSQPTLNYIKNETSTSAGLGTARANDKGGYITTINVDASQQNYAWKAYVGNVTGKMVLENSGQYSIFEWEVGNVMGNVYISRNGTVDWNSVNCSNRTVIQSEDTKMKLNSANSNSINKTFNGSTHKSFSISGIPYANSNCPAISTYVNDTKQANNEAAKFQEVLLSDSKSNLIYMTMMEQDTIGYDNTTYDFQAIVAEDESLSVPSIYYFYVELSG